jgi:hypothetical protein
VATREEKVQLIEELKQEIERLKLELAALVRRRRRRELAGGLLRTGIVLLAMSIGFGIGAVVT